MKRRGISLRGLGCGGICPSTPTIVRLPFDWPRFMGRARASELLRVTSVVTSPSNRLSVNWRNVVVRVAWARLVIF
jgi:hypothetical protein